MLSSPLFLPEIWMFIFASLSFRLDATGASNLQLLSIIRRGFPESFRTESVRLGIPEAYDRTFGQALSSDPSAVKRFQKPPLPFAFKISDSSEFYVGRSLILNIAGKAVNDVSCYIGAVRGVFSAVSNTPGITVKIRQVATISADGNESLVEKDDGEVSLIGVDDILPPLWSVSAVQIDFVTPIQLVREGHLLHRLTFSDFIRPLMRRVSALSYYYCGFEYDLDFQRMAADSLDVSADDASLAWVKGAGNSSGIKGGVRFFGDLQPYIPFIMLGEQFNLGKGASYGMGAYGIYGVECPANK